MSLQANEPSAWRKKYDAIATVPGYWWLIPRRAETYAARFEGTFEEAMAQAVSSSAFWKSTVYVHQDDTAKDVAPKDRVGKLWGEVSVPKNSPVRIPS